MRPGPIPRQQLLLHPRLQIVPSRPAIRKISVAPGRHTWRRYSHSTQQREAGTARVEAAVGVEDAIATSCVCAWAVRVDDGASVVEVACVKEFEVGVA